MGIDQGSSGCVVSAYCKRGCLRKVIDTHVRGLWAPRFLTFASERGRHPPPARRWILGAFRSHIFSSSSALARRTVFAGIYRCGKSIFINMSRSTHVKNLNQLLQYSISHPYINENYLPQPPAAVLSCRIHRDHSAPFLFHMSSTVISPQNKFRGWRKE